MKNKITRMFFVGIAVGSVVYAVCKHIKQKDYDKPVLIGEGYRVFSVLIDED